MSSSESLLPAPLPSRYLSTTQAKPSSIKEQRTRFLPTFPLFFGFGLARKAKIIARHIEFWLSPANSEAQESHSLALNLLQTSSEAELGGRDRGRQAKAQVPASHSYLGRLLGQTWLATANNVSVQEKPDHMIKLGIYESPCSIK